MTKSNQLRIIISIFTIIFIVFFVYYYYYDNFESGNLSLRIPIEEAKARRFGLIIDGRTPKEREILGYYPNSIPISPERVKEEVPLLISNKNTWILIYCNTGNNAANAANAAHILYKMGYRNVRYINESYLSLMPGSS
jgi:rhodanese-related sulfurtransferase